MKRERRRGFHSKICISPGGKIKKKKKRGQAVVQGYFFRRDLLSG